MWWIPDVLACLPLRDDDAAGFIPRMVSSCSGICLESLREGKDECPLFRPSNIFLKLKDLGQLSLRPNVRTIPNYTSQLLSPHTFFYFLKLYIPKKEANAIHKWRRRKPKRHTYQELVFSFSLVFVLSPPNETNKTIIKELQKNSLCYPCFLVGANEWNREMLMYFFLGWRDNVRCMLLKRNWNGG